MEKTVKSVCIDIHTEEIEKVVRNTIEKIIKDEEKAVIKQKIGEEFEAFLKNYNCSAVYEEELEKTYETFMKDKVRKELQKILSNTFYGDFLPYQRRELHRTSFELGWDTALWLNDILNSANDKDYMKDMQMGVVESAGRHLAYEIRMNSARYKRLAEILEEQVATKEETI